MTTWKYTAIAAALAAILPLPAAAQSSAELLNELRALRDKVNQLEKRLQDNEAKAAAAPAPGMTPDQQADFNRIALKAEALEDTRDALGLKGLKITGYMDPTFVYNQRQNRAGFQFLNSVSNDGYNYDNSYFGAAVIDFTKETESGTRWRLSLAPNRGVGSALGDNSPIHEASVSIPLPSDDKMRIIAGQIPDWSGYEYLQPTLNKLITHNLLFDFTLPTAYTGAGMEITDGKWIYKGVIANLNSTKRTSGNKSPVLAYRVDYARGEFGGFGFAGVHGKATNSTTNVPDLTSTVPGAYIEQKDSILHTFEVDGYFIRGDWTVQGQASVGMQRKAAITVDPVTGDLRDSRWWGLSGLTAYKFTPRFEGTVRADYLNNKKNGGGLLGYNAADDRNGIGPGYGDLTSSKGANRYALTLGLSYLFNPNTTLKAEYRLDRASEPVFIDVNSGMYKKSNQLLATSVVVSF